ncbi:hypothetical protein AB1L30_10295 [Bremerella sp. JC817]|uniref:hypothetical protein n=1 Tax=Bremerella sp. JC817 TaxID=3231756 RepID=UPI0034587027
MKQLFGSVFVRNREEGSVSNPKSSEQEKQKKRPIANLLHFSPQHWGEVERFTQFWTTTYTFDRMTQKRLRGIAGHFSKAGYLFQLAKRLAPNLDLDAKQLEESGYSPAHNSKELAAVIESVFCEQYSAIDCCRFVLFKVFPDHKGIKDSTRKTFQKAFEGEIDQRVPVAIRDAIANTKEWYFELLRLRDELTHSNVGSCHRDDKTGNVMYMHDGLGTPGKSLVIEDVFAALKTYFDKINDLLGLVFRELNRMLDDKPVELMCGIFGGRCYQRVVRPSEAIDINGGVCKSYQWFDLEEHPDCPLKDGCQAYARAKGEQLADG